MCRRKEISFVFPSKSGYMTGSQLCISLDNKDILSASVSVIRVRSLASDLGGDANQIKQQISCMLFMQVSG